MKSVNTRFYLLGERAAVLESRPPVDLVCQRRIWWLAAALRAQHRFIDIVPGMNNLTVVFDPLRQNSQEVLDQLSTQWQQAKQQQFEPREVRIPVCYGGKAGPDLDNVSSYTGLTPEAVIALHSSVDYTVFFLGFQPGFAYMGGLPDALITPRRAEPRLAVPAGSVGIGGAQTGIYPAQSPGGWQLIGRTSLTLFDPYSTSPSLLLPGDQVRFVPEPDHA
ncbi:5-oxoprolinase subunit PxpB [Chitinivorax sp. B]|uniref:5-oxoprolinase subunit PxpB n=1 Tax=Chitinivorax sp. B TaxID=2502235 RepID=UPI0010F52CDD|nr:5-oxoprolinase subunit PxpB [Chitinivorax sp. B]